MSQYENEGTPHNGTSTAEKLQASRELRFDRMRLGQSVADIVAVPSDPTIQVALVPLWEEELHQAQIATGAKELPFTIWNQRIYERWEQYEILIRALREPGSFTDRIFFTVEDMQKVLEPSDINHLAESYLALTEHSSPSVEGFTEEQVDDLKKVLAALDWNVLSGRQWYLLKSFLSSLSPEQLGDNLVGSSLTSYLTAIRNEIASAVSADQKLSPTNSAPDAEQNLTSEERSESKSNEPKQEQDEKEVIIPKPKF